MNSIKRIMITTVVGLIAGAAAVWLTTGVGASLPAEVITRMLLNFTLMGFVIGISTLRWHWAINGLFFGAVFGILEGLASVAAGLPLFIPLVYGMIVGVQIESITAGLFKSGVRSPSATNAL
jgi:hypothetical protein